MLSHFQLFATLWTVALQAPLSMGIFQASILEWVAMPSFKGSSQPLNQTHISCISCMGKWVLCHEHHLGSPQNWPHYGIYLLVPALLLRPLRFSLTPLSLGAGNGNHSSIILAWRIPWTEESGGLHFTELQRTGHDWSNLVCMHAPSK